jgi:hypothetical protein
MQPTTKSTNSYTIHNDTNKIVTVNAVLATTGTYHLYRKARHEMNLNKA